MSYVKSPHSDQRPREKMMEHGARMLRDDELLAIILNTGIPGKGGAPGIDVHTAAKMMLNDFGLKGLFSGWNEPGELSSTTGLGNAKSCTLAAIGEVIRRLGEKDRAEISSPEDAYKYFADLRDAKKEHVRIACLTPENLVFYHEDAALGDAKGAECPLISVFHPPIRFYAQRIIVAHNHPRGSAKPSEEDYAWQADLVETAKKLRIDVVDHVIIGKDDTFSFADAGLC